MGVGSQLHTGLAQARARHALEAAGLDASVPLERMSSVTNEVWLSPDVAVRVNRRLDQRLWREAQLGPQLPEAVHYPEILGYGTGSGFDWLVARRRPGRVLSRCWPTMTPTERRRAITHLAAMLQVLHRTPCPPALCDLPDVPQLISPGSDPMVDLLEALERATNLEHVDRALIASIATFVHDAEPLVRTFDVDTLVHGDLTFENVLWDGEAVSALIDFEWSRAAPRDLDLDVLLRFCAYPFLHVAADYEDQTKAQDYQDVPFWLREDYPLLFDAPRALDRVRLFGIAFDVRELLANPPEHGVHELSEHHPLRRLGRLAAGTSHLDALAEGIASS